MIIKKLKILIAERHLRSAYRSLQLGSGSVSDISFQAKEELILTCRKMGLTPAELKLNEAGLAKAYRLYLHKQYMAFLAENVRQKIIDLDRLKGIERPDLWCLDENLDDPASNSFNKEMFSLFLDELEPVLVDFEAVNFHPRS